MSDEYFTSPQRYDFLKQFRKKSFDEGHITSEQYQEWMDYIEKCRNNDADPNSESHPSLEKDLRHSQQIADKCKGSKSYSQNLYAALCNNEFKKEDKVWGCSWRHAGGIIANLREEGDYIDWYCSGIGTEIPNYVGESFVTDEIRKDIESFGWLIIEHEVGEL